jgi:predicted AlkP superfamily pyrophosphatase or phosphodiesterase
MSIFHSVPPMRHNTLDNTYVPQYRPVDSLCQVLRRAKRTSATYYTFEVLRDLWRPGSCAASTFIDMYVYENADEKITEAALKGIAEYPCDFTFIYLGQTDLCGHYNGWMSDTYKKHVARVGELVEKIVKALPEHHIMITSDHGGHDRMHGTNAVEDMTVPIILKKRIPEKAELTGASVLDIAPTVCKLLGVDDLPDEWEGKSLI